MAVFDVDGTLYDLDEHIVPESCKEALAQMKNNGILFAIATGRAHYGLGKAINDLHADYILAANGGVVVDKNNTILSHSDMTLEECEKLIEKVRAVLEKAIQAGGSTLRDYQKPDGSLGYFQNQHCVYNKTGQKCPGCTCSLEKTGGIRKIVLGGRSTFYCPIKQK